jgi:hypothetical protein
MSHHELMQEPMVNEIYDAFNQFFPAIVCARTLKRFEFDFEKACDHFCSLAGRPRRLNGNQGYIVEKTVISESLVTGYWSDEKSK